MKELLYDVIVVGGGPGAAAECARLCDCGKRVAVISDGFGGCMGLLGRQRLQSYVHELEIHSPLRRLGDYVHGFDQVAPTGAEFSDYVSDLIDSLPVVRIFGHVIGIRRTRNRFVVECHSNGVGRDLQAIEIILATGIAPRGLEQWAVGAKCITCFEAYRDISFSGGSQFCGRDVVVVGSGNSAYQIAAGVARLAESVVILANKYLGMFPQETDNRFGLRAPSQLALEMIAKTGVGDIFGSINNRAKEPAGIWLHVYERLAWSEEGDSFSACVRREDNLAKVPALSFEIARKTGRLELYDKSEERYLLKIPKDKLLLVSAIGVKARLPECAWPTLINPSTGFVAHECGRTSIPGLYVAGACAGYRAVNSMQSPDQKGGSREWYRGGPMEGHHAFYQG